MKKYKYYIEKVIECFWMKCMVVKWRKNFGSLSKVFKKKKDVSRKWEMGGRMLTLRRTYLRSEKTRWSENMVYIRKKNLNKLDETDSLTANPNGNWENH